MKRLDRRDLFPGPHEECDARISEMAAAALDHDAHRRQLQARNTELVEENRRLRSEPYCGRCGRMHDCAAAPPPGRGAWATCPKGHTSFLEPGDYCPFCPLPATKEKP